MLKVILILVRFAAATFTILIIFALLLVIWSSYAGVFDDMSHKELQTIYMLSTFKLLAAIFVWAMCNLGIKNLS